MHASKARALEPASHDMREGWQGRLRAANHVHAWPRVYCLLLLLLLLLLLPLLPLLHRYAGYVGATTEFSKWEGISFDAKRNRLYISMSEVRYGMEDFKAKGKASPAYDQCGSNDLRIEVSCAAGGGGGAHRCPCTCLWCTREVNWVTLHTCPCACLWWCRAPMSGHECKRGHCGAVCRARCSLLGAVPAAAPHPPTH